MHLFKAIAFNVVAIVVVITALPAGMPVASAQVGQIDTQPAIAAIMNAGNRADRVKGITKVPSVGVVRLDFIALPFSSDGIPSWQEFRILAQRNAAGVRKLQHALMANAATRDALARNGVEAWQVAGAQISSKGSLRLYIFSRWERRPL